MPRPPAAWSVRCGRGRARAVGRQLVGGGRGDPHRRPPPHPPPPHPHPPPLGGRGAARRAAADGGAPGFPPAPAAGGGASARVAPDGPRLAPAVRAPVDAPPAGEPRRRGRPAGTATARRRRALPRPPTLPLPPPDAAPWVPPQTLATGTRRARARADVPSPHRPLRTDHGGSGASTAADGRRRDQRPGTGGVPKDSHNVEFGAPPQRHQFDYQGLQRDFPAPAGNTTRPYSRSPKNPAVQQFQKCSKSASAGS